MIWFLERGKKLDIRKPYISIEGQAVGTGLNQILKIDFNGYEVFHNTEETITCVVVAGSDLERGTFSHLTNKIDPISYARQLAKVWGRKRPNLALVGGDESYANPQFAYNLENALVSEGFRIAGTEVGGRGVVRSVRMYSDKLLIQEKSTGNNHLSKQIQF